MDAYGLGWVPSVCLPSIPYTSSHPFLVSRPKTVNGWCHSHNTRTDPHIHLGFLTEGELAVTLVHESLHQAFYRIRAPHRAHDWLDRRKGNDVEGLGLSVAVGDGLGPSGPIRMDTAHTRPPDPI
jgi:hypothetical protein